MPKLVEFEIKTGGRLDALDITDDVAASVEALGVSEGSVLVFSPHTTCCILLASPGRETVRSLQEAMDSVAPADQYYEHDDLSIRTENLEESERPNAPAHIAHMLFGRASESIPLSEGRLALGEDQRVLFVELDDSRKRRYVVQVIGE
ncbi:MAG TPA: secondary thiamine-phosphate synthase enzyme YjbQ [Actinomycetota bacterium]|nr:secondary thiamine-phosphate synthase enzyme YjbQ [Actinomycetota bacterium]